MPPRVNKEAANAHDQKVNDKTFGMKNKNKSKQVQNKISHMKMSGGASDVDSFAKQARPLLHTSGSSCRPSCSPPDAAPALLVAEEGTAEGCRGRAGHGPLQGGQEEE